MNNINDLPDLCLRTIFSKLPLRDLLRIDQVCPAWERIQLSVCLMRNELIILIGDESDQLFEDSPFAIPYYDGLLDKNQNAPKVISESKDQNQLEFDWLDGHLAKLVTRLLPNITTVCIAIRYVEPVINVGVKSWGVKEILMDQVIVLLTKWSQSVQTLKIFIHFDESNCEEKQVEMDLKKLVSTINAFPTLRHLTIILKNDFFFENLDSKTVDLSILSRLEEFYLEYQQDLSILDDSLDKYAKDAPHLRVLAIDGILQNSVETGALLRYDEKLAEKFTQLSDFELSKANFDMTSLCTKFWRLERLKIRIDLNTQQIYKFIKMLQPLKNLVYLDIYLQMNISDNDEANRRRRAEEEQEGIADFESIPSLSSVKIVKMGTFLRSHNVADSIQWDRMLPNLEILQYFDYYGDCEICESNKNDDRQDEHNDNTNQEQQNNEAEIIVNINSRESKHDKCLNFALQPWKHCAKLHSVYTGDQGCLNVKKRSLDELYDRD